MEKDFEKHLVDMSTHLLFTIARLNSLEKILFAYINVELSDHKEVALLLRKQFLSAYIENIGEVMQSLPSTLSQHPFLLAKSRQKIRDTLSEIEKLS
jgi:hypothetical protein